MKLDILLTFQNLQEVCVPDFNFNQIRHIGFKSFITVIQKLSGNEFSEWTT